LPEAACRIQPPIPSSDDASDAAIDAALCQVPLPDGFMHRLDAMIADVTTNAAERAG
jgi:hypothetical protein